MIGNKKYFIDLINSSKANKMTALYHYSGVGFKKATVNLGIFRREDQKLVGVLQWGCSYQDNIKLDRYVKEPIDKKDYLELNRFCMADSEGKNSESQAISLGIKWIKKNMPNIKLLVSYAGRKEGNYGYIYQATNWEYLGYFISQGFWSIDGHEKHLTTLWSHYTKDKKGLSFYDSLMKEYKDVRKTWTKQFIYIQRLDKKLTPAIIPLEYPKLDNEYPIKTREEVFIRDDEIYNNPEPVKREFVEYYYEKETKLFTRATLLRRGELTKPKIVMFNSHGIYENTFDKTAEIVALGYGNAGICKSIKDGKPYKSKFFKKYYKEDDIPEEIEVPYICIIDEIPFISYTEAAEYLGCSKQAVQQSHHRNSKKVMEKEIIWANI